MKITKKQLRKIIRESLLVEYTPGYTVPDFETQEDMMLFLDEFDPDDEVETDVVNPETGEVVLTAGETLLAAGIVEEEPEPDEGYEEDKLDHYDWDDWEQEQEERIQDEQEAYDRALEKAREQAEGVGEDWARDMLHDARRSSRDWEGQYDSAESYLEALGQDAATDLAAGIVEWGDEDIRAVYESLPEKEPADYHYSSIRPQKYVFKEIVADYVYDGVLKVAREKK
jgi:hypothetical protein